MNFLVRRAKFRSRGQGVRRPRSAVRRSYTERERMTCITNNAYLVFSDHSRVHLRELSAVLVMVDSLASLTLDQLSPDNPSLHSRDPGFSNVQVLLIQTL